MVHIIKSVTLNTDEGPIEIAGPFITYKPIKIFKEEFMDKASKDYSFIAFSCDLKYI